MAWLHAKPRPAAGTRRAETFDITMALTRFAQMKKTGIVPTMPPCVMPHVVDRLTEIGLTGSNGMSAVPLAWGEINEWQRASRIRLPSWEARLIRAMSVAYVAESHAAEDETCPPPWRGEVTEAVKSAELAALDSIF